MSDSEFTIVRRGRGNVLLYEGYEYYKHSTYKKSESGELWRCAAYKKSKCAATLNILPDKTIKKSGGGHIGTCVADLNKEEMTKVMNNCIDKVCEVSDTVPAVFDEAVAALKDSGLHLVEGISIPSFSNVKSSLYRRRNKAAGVQKMAFRNLAEVEVPAKFSNFLLADFEGEDRILLFATKEAREVMGKVSTCFGDGTFKSCPEPFAQLYTIHGDLGSSVNTTNIIPLVYALLPNKSASTYETMLDLIRSQVPAWNPKQFVTDFEEGAIGAIAKKFPEVEQRGCYYHFCNSLWRKAKFLKLIKNKLSRRIVALCCKLPLLPNEGNIRDGWEYVKTEQQMACSSTSMTAFMRYMEYWMSARRVTLLCAFGERHRTNNYAEGWHHKLNSKFKGRPTIYALLTKLEEDGACATVQASSRQVPKKRPQVTIDNDVFIQTTQMQLVMGEIDIPLFLEKLR